MENINPGEKPTSNEQPIVGSFPRPPVSRGPGLIHKTLASAGNLSNLLPTGTVLAFQALVPPFSHNGVCHIAGKYLTMSLIIIIALICFLSSFTDSFLGPNGKLYHGIATPKGIFVFNSNRCDEEEKDICEDVKDMSKFRIRFMDCIHAFTSLMVFLVFALGHPHVLRCFLGVIADENWVHSIILNLPLGLGTLASFLFVLFPTNRRGFGYADKAAN